MDKKYSLTIYGEDDAIVKTYGTDIIRYGILEEALRISEESKDSDSKSRLGMISPLLFSLFKGLTEEELRDADINDVFNLFGQILSIAQGLSSKNQVKE